MYIMLTSDMESDLEMYVSCWHPSLVFFSFTHSNTTKLCEHHKLNAYNANTPGILNRPSPVVQMFSITGTFVVRVAL